MEMTIGTLAGELFNVTVNLIPDNFTLGEVYPNPFNPTTSFDLSVPEDGFVSIQVYNVLGQLVATIYEGNLNASTHSFNWNADNVSSGMYFLEVESDKDIAIRKMMLMK